MTNETYTEPQQNFEVKIRILGNEIFAIGISTSNDSNRWAVLGLISIFSVMTVIGAYGDKFVSLYHYLVN